MRHVLEGASKTDLVRAWGRLTIADVVGNGYPALSKLQRTYGRDKVETTLAVLLVEASGYFADRLPKEQAKEIAVEITTEYYWFTLEDVYVVLQRMKRKSLYGKLTPNKVLTELDAYREERLELAARRNEEEHMRRFTRRVRDPRDRAEEVRLKEAMWQALDKYNSEKDNQ